MPVGPCRVAAEDSHFHAKFNWAGSPKLLLAGVSERSGAVLGQTFLQSGRSAPVLNCALTAITALERLTEEAFDCLVVLDSGVHSGRPGIDATSFCAATRAAGCPDAILVLTEEAADNLWRVTCDTESELYVGPIDWHSPTLLALIDRARRRNDQDRNHQRHHWREGQRVDRDRDDCSDLLQQQRRLLLETAAEQYGNIDAILPPELPLIYREVLRTYVMTGTVSLTDEIRKLVRAFSLAHLTPRQVLQLHLDQLESLVASIGQRSARHVIDRANVLCLELMVLLCERSDEQNARTWWAWRRKPVADIGLPLERRAA